MPDFDENDGEFDDDDDDDGGGGAARRRISLTLLSYQISC